MTSVRIVLNSIENVKAFVNSIGNFDCDFDLGSARILIDAKSIMGVLSLGLAKPLDLTIHCSENVEPILEAIQPYVVSAE